LKIVIWKGEDMKKSDYMVKTKKDPMKMKDVDVMSAELIELQRVFMMDYHEVDGVPLFIFERISDNALVSYWIWENLDDTVFLIDDKVDKSLLEKPIWIAIWHLKRREFEQVVVGQIMNSLDELVPLAIDDPPFSHINGKKHLDMIHGAKNFSSRVH
jgi:hypothetical protein